MSYLQFRIPYLLALYTVSLERDREEIDGYWTASTQMPLRGRLSLCLSREEREIRYVQLYRYGI